MKHFTRLILSSLVRFYCCLVVLRLLFGGYYFRKQINHTLQIYSVHFISMLSPVILLLKILQLMSLQNCQNRIKPLKKQTYAQIRLKFGENAQKSQKELKQPANQNSIYDLSEKIQLADKDSEIYQKFSKVSSRQSFASKKQKYRRSVYKSKQDNGKESYIFKSPTKEQKMVIAEQVRFSDSCAIYKRLSVMEKQHNNSTQLVKKAFEENSKKTIKPGSKQKYRKSRSSHQSVNPRYSINSDTSEQFSKWINKNLSIESDQSDIDSFIDKVNPENRKDNRNPQSRIIQTSFSMQSSSKHSQSVVFSQNTDKSNSNIMDYNNNHCSNVQQIGSIAQDQQFGKKYQQEDLQQIFFGKRQTQNQNGKQQNFVKHWQQKSVLIQKKLCMIKQDTHENDSDSSVSQQQSKKPRIQSEILFPSHKNSSYQTVNFDRSFQKKETNKMEDIELEKAIMKDKALKKQIQKARLEYHNKKAQKQIKGQVKQQPECMIM